MKKAEETRNSPIHAPGKQTFEENLDSIFEQLISCTERIKKENEEMLKEMSSRRVPEFSMPDGIRFPFSARDSEKQLETDHNPE